MRTWSNTKQLDSDSMTLIEHYNDPRRSLGLLQNVLFLVCKFSFQLFLLFPDTSSHMWRQLVSLMLLGMTFDNFTDDLTERALLITIFIPLFSHLCNRMCSCIGHGVVTPFKCIENCHSSALLHQPLVVTTCERGMQLADIIISATSWIDCTGLCR
jgi:hypothetical protein